MVGITELSKSYAQKHGISIAEAKRTIKSVLDEVLDAVYDFGGVQIIESARNDIYVIFKIDANVLNNLTAGEYHILNQDDEYISSGQWVVA